MHVPPALFSLFVVASAVTAAADGGKSHPGNERTRELFANIAEDVIRFPIGRTDEGRLIWCLAQPEALDYRTPKQRRLIVGGLDGTETSVLSALALFQARSAPSDVKVAWACVPIADPDRWNPDSNPGVESARFPPGGTTYQGPNRQWQFLWRFIGWMGPDVVEEVHATSVSGAGLHGSLSIESRWPDHSLAASLRKTPVAGIGTTLSLRVGVEAGSGTTGESTRLQQGKRLATAIQTAPQRVLGGNSPVEPTDRSPLRLAIQERLGRSPRQVAEQLASRYGHHLDKVMYQPALSLIARIRMSEFTGERSHLNEVEQILEPYLSGESPTLGERVSGSQLAGHLIFAERLNGENSDDALDLLEKAAGYAFEDDGSLRDAMPFHHEMSDAVFMGCPILTAAGRYSGEDRYFMMAGRHLRFMQRHCLRDDGIYRHSPLCEAAWGRGNGFPALGLALSLSDLDALRKPGQAATELRTLMLRSLTDHLRALVQYQDATGMWHQVVDDPGSYPELTSTCMITYAIVRAIRSGWVEAAEFRPVAENAWQAIRVRVGEDGILFDVCTGTGKQNSMQAYLDRKAILGHDERGGAMALMAAVEVAAARRDGILSEPPDVQ